MGKMNMKEFFAQPPRERASEIERARMRRALEAARPPRPRHEAPPEAEALASEMRAMRSEVAGLRDMLLEIGQAPANDEVLTRHQAAELLRLNIDVISKLVRTEGLPCKRVGKEYRFLRSEVLAWLSTRGGKR